MHEFSISSQFQPGTNQLELLPRKCNERDSLPHCMWTYKTLQTEFYKGSRFRMSPNPSKLPVDKHRTLMVTPERWGDGSQFNFTYGGDGGVFWKPSSYSCQSNGAAFEVFTWQRDSDITTESRQHLLPKHQQHEVAIRWAKRTWPQWSTLRVPADSSLDGHLASSSGWATTWSEGYQ